MPFQFFILTFIGSVVHFRKKITVNKTIRVYQCRVLIENGIKLVTQAMYLLMKVTFYYIQFYHLSMLVAVRLLCNVTLKTETNI